ncbi:MAG: putative porin, partial [Cyclobacteriaceae bacterium]
MRKLSSLFFILIAGYAYTQIVDDSTKLVYGPTTVEFTNEFLIKNNFNNRYQNPDTLVYEFEKYNRVDASDRKFQSLGFLGSALFDLEYDLPSHPGRTMGFTGYDQYFKDVNSIRYFDTKSPYMDLGVVLGGDNRSKIDFSFSRNINPHWNIGFDVNRITADKQIGGEGQGDRATESSLFDIYVNYFNEEKPYGMAFSITSMNHRVADIGGVFVDSEEPTRADFFQYQDSEVLLDDAVAEDKRRRYHLYHEYKLGSGFQLYHQADYTTQENTFADDSTGGGDQYVNFYPNFFLDSDTTRDQTIYSAFENEAGLKGNIKGAFYRFYLKRRELIYNPKGSLETTESETYAGTYLRFDWKDKFSVSGIGELSNEGAYRLEGTLASEFVNITYVSQRALQSFLVQSYTGNHHYWNNSFEPQFSNKVSARLKLNLNRFEISPEGSLSTISNMVYFNEEQIPVQETSAILLYNFGGSLSFNFLRMNENEYFRLENRITNFLYSPTGTGIIRSPSVRYAGRLFWRGLWFQDAVPVEVGADVYYRSGYTSNQ